MATEAHSTRRWRSMTRLRAGVRDTFGRRPLLATRWHNRARAGNMRAHRGGLYERYATVVTADCRRGEHRHAGRCAVPFLSGCAGAVQDGSTIYVSGKHERARRSPADHSMRNCRASRSELPRVSEPGGLRNVACPCWVHRNRDCGRCLGAQEVAKRSTNRSRHGCAVDVCGHSRVLSVFVGP